MARVRSVSRCVAVGWCMMLVVSASAHADEELKKDFAQHRVEKLTRLLELTPEQHTQVQRVTDDYMARRKALRDQLEALRQEEDAQIKALLTPDQQAKFGQWQERKEERRKEHMERKKDRKEGKAPETEPAAPEGGQAL